MAGRQQDRAGISQLGAVKESVLLPRNRDKHGKCDADPEAVDPEAKPEF